MSAETFLQFSKYHGLGNHFIFVDNRDGKLDLNNPPLIKWLCDSRTGVGADGVAEIKTCDNLSHSGCKYRYEYYICDGRKGDFCGNGSRCSVQFAVNLGIVSADEEFIFCGFDGEHLGRLESETGLVYVSISDVDGSMEKFSDKQYRIFTGTDVVVNFVKDLRGIDLHKIGAHCVERYTRFKEGVVVMFVKEEANGDISMRSYESGLKGESWACGTGAIGAALVTETNRQRFLTQTKIQVTVNVRIGKIIIKATRTGTNTFSDIYLIGPTCHVFDGITRL